MHVEHATVVIAARYLAQAWRHRREHTCLGAGVAQQATRAARASQQRQKRRALDLKSGGTVQQGGAEQAAAAACTSPASSAGSPAVGIAVAAAALGLAGAAVEQGRWKAGRHSRLLLWCPSPPHHPLHGSRPMRPPHPTVPTRLTGERNQVVNTEASSRRYMPAQRQARNGAES